MSDRQALNRGSGQRFGGRVQEMWHVVNSDHPRFIGLNGWRSLGQYVYCVLLIYSNVILLIYDAGLIPSHRRFLGWAQDISWTQDLSWAQDNRRAQDLRTPELAIADSRECKWACNCEFVPCIVTHMYIGLHERCMNKFNETLLNSSVMDLPYIIKS